MQTISLNAEVLEAGESVAIQVLKSRAWANPKRVWLAERLLAFIELERQRGIHAQAA